METSCVELFETVEDIKRRNQEITDKELAAQFSAEKLVEEVSDTS